MRMAPLRRNQHAFSGVPRRRSSGICIPAIARSNLKRSDMAVTSVECLVGRTGFEPVPFGLKGRCADSYTSDPFPVDLSILALPVVVLDLRLIRPTGPTGDSVRCPRATRCGCAVLRRGFRCAHTTTGPCDGPGRCLPAPWRHARMRDAVDVFPSCKRATRFPMAFPPRVSRGNKKPPGYAPAGGSSTIRAV